MSDGIFINEISHADCSFACFLTEAADKNRLECKISRDFNASNRCSNVARLITVTECGYATKVKWSAFNLESRISHRVFFSIKFLLLSLTSQQQQQQQQLECSSIHLPAISLSPSKHIHSFFHSDDFRCVTKQTIIVKKINLKVFFLHRDG